MLRKVRFCGTVVPKNLAGSVSHHNGSVDTPFGGDELSREGPVVPGAKAVGTERIYID